jgi:hypothetical protein
MLCHVYSKFILVILDDKILGKLSLETTTNSKNSVNQSTRHKDNNLEEKNKSSKTSNSKVFPMVKSKLNVQRQIYPDEVPPWLPGNKTVKKRRKIIFDPAYTTGCTEKGETAVRDIQQNMTFLKI